MDKLSKFLTKDRKTMMFTMLVFNLIMALVVNWAAAKAVGGAVLQTMLYTIVFGG